MSRREYTMCAYCNSVEGGHTLACQAIHADGEKPRQVPKTALAVFHERYLHCDEDSMALLASDLLEFAEGLLAQEPK